MYPYLNEGVVVRHRTCAFAQPSDHLAITRANEAFHLSDFLTSAIGEMDGTNSLSSLSLRYGLDLPRIVEDLVSAGILALSTEARKNSYHPQQYRRIDGLVAACRTAIWHSTRRCNLACQHCYYLYQKEEKLDFSAEEIESIVNNLASLGVEYVTLTGGELLANRETLCRATALLNELCIPFSVNTNGTLAPRELLSIFASSAYSRMIQTSIDGPEAIHDSMRGRKGSFAKTLATIRTLSEAGIFVRVVSMLTSDWMKPETILATAKTLSNAGVRDWLVEVPSSTGRWQKKVSQDQEDALYIVAVTLAGYCQQGEHQFRRVALNQVYEWPHEATRNKVLSDPACFHDLGLLSFGPEGISFCTLFRDQFGTEWKDMQSATKPMLGVWNKIAAQRVDHPLSANPSCRDCELFDWCQGGCPGHYSDPAAFNGCDFHSRLLALVRRRMEAALQVQ